MALAGCLAYGEKLYLLGQPQCSAQNSCSRENINTIYYSVKNHTAVTQRSRGCPGHGGMVGGVEAQASVVG